MSNMFSSPSKQASSVANAEQGINQKDISQLEDYVTNQEQQLRGGIGALGPNPYLAAGGATAAAGPSQTSPSYTANFSGSNPGVTSGMPPPSSNPFAPKSAGPGNAQPPKVA